MRREERSSEGQTAQRIKSVDTSLTHETTHPIHTLPLHHNIAVSSASSISFCHLICCACILHAPELTSLSYCPTSSPRTSHLISNSLPRFRVISSSIDPRTRKAHHTLLPFLALSCHLAPLQLPAPTSVRSLSPVLSAVVRHHCRLHSYTKSCTCQPLDCDLSSWAASRSFLLLAKGCTSLDNLPTVI